MADPNADSVAFWISEDGTNVDFRSLRSVLLDGLPRHLPKKSEEEIAELAESLQMSVLNKLYLIADPTDEKEGGSGTVRLERHE